MTDTIFAVSSGKLPAAIAVMRISGARAFAVVERLAGRLPPPRRASLRTLTDPASGEPLDRAIIILFPGPTSATGEDLAEIHLHGSRAVVSVIALALSSFDGVRPAEAGEFTRRALLNDRIDLTEAEGLADLLAAETEAQRRAAMISAEGGLRRLVEEWTDRALMAAAMIEAAIDHVDEDDVDEDVTLTAARGHIAMLADDIAEAMARPPAERLRDGIRVVFAGPPNSGKSSLFNKMIGRDAAIVSDVAGTTRDRIDMPVEHGGLAWLLTDTAGLAQDTQDPIEAIGIERARSAMDTADLVLWLGDDAPRGDAIAVHARADLPGRNIVPRGRIAASAVGASGDVEIWGELHARAGKMMPRTDVPHLNERQRMLCQSAGNNLRSARSQADPLLAAEHLRMTLLRFDRITGRANTEAMLDALFGTFCIGK